MVADQGPVDRVRNDVFGRARGPGVKVRCEVVERDRHGRLVAKVFSPNGVDIGRRLVSAGYAAPYRRYPKDYVDTEDEARRVKRGMWRGNFVKPWAWRDGLPPGPAQGHVRVAAAHAGHAVEVIEAITLSWWPLRPLLCLRQAG